tara:strand:- start:105 stop:569 length:465 start_codon:yes stop_codon:yes gene_type:complete
MEGLILNCPKCSSLESKVVDSRSIHKGTSIRRRRECIDCSYRFTSYEYIQKNPIMIIKKNGDREEYKRSKIESSFHIACKKRSISEEVIQSAIIEFEEKLNNISRIEVDSSYIGELVMQKLKKIDKIAYIRFASVYREFKDLGEFQMHIENLNK